MPAGEAAHSGGEQSLTLESNGQLAAHPHIGDENVCGNEKKIIQYSNPKNVLGAAQRPRKISEENVLSCNRESCCVFKHQLNNLCLCRKTNF